MEKKQTAVEWLFEKITQNKDIRWRGTRYLELFEKAKKMEKEQIINADNIKKKEEQEEKRGKEFSEWFNEAWDKSINSHDKHAEDWN
jgi:hypothetical protein